ncbi:MAG: hypothetical protein JRN35_10950 [Nitrososphaerota archaeon]|nr:hypothetical protein [Nitrososphaerota archaeon]
MVPALTILILPLLVYFTILPSPFVLFLAGFGGGLVPLEVVTTTERREASKRHRDLMGELQKTAEQEAMAAAKVGELTALLRQTRSDVTSVVDEATKRQQTRVKEERVAFVAGVCLALLDRTPQSTPFSTIFPRGTCQSWEGRLWFQKHHETEWHASPDVGFAYAAELLHVDLNRADLDALDLLKASWYPWVNEYSAALHDAVRETSRARSYEPSLSRDERRELAREVVLCEASDRLSSSFKRQLGGGLAVAFGVGEVVGTIACNAKRGTQDWRTVGNMFRLDTLEMQSPSEATIPKWAIERLRQISRQVSDLGLQGLESRKLDRTKINCNAVLRELASLVSHVIDPTSFA